MTATKWLEFFNYSLVPWEAGCARQWSFSHTVRVLCQTSLYVIDFFDPTAQCSLSLYVLDFISYYHRLKNHGKEIFRMNFGSLK